MRKIQNAFDQRTKEVQQRQCALFLSFQANSEGKENALDSHAKILFEMILMQL